jgi:phage anti-repressor protein
MSNNITNTENQDFSLIQLKANGKVEARNLHLFLQSKKEFAHWIQKIILDYEFTEKQDFDKIVKPHENNKIDFELTIEMAKEICMLSKSQFGKRARLYFLECEKKTKTIPTQKPLTLIELLDLTRESEIARIQAEKELKVATKEIDTLNDRNVETLFLKAKETRTGINNIKRDIGVEINSLVQRAYGHITDYADRHRTAHKHYYFDTSKIYIGATKSSIDSKIAYKNWLLTIINNQNQLQLS